MSGLHYLDPNPGGNVPVLLLHGLGTDGSSWVLQLAALAGAGFRPIAPDAPGFGASGYNGKGWSAHRLADQLADLLRGLEAVPAHVIGLSMGGVLAQQFAHDHPALVSKLILVSTFTVLRPDSPSGWKYFLRRAFSVLTRGPDAQAQIVAERVFPEARDAELRAMLVRSIRSADPRAYRGAMLTLAGFDSRRWLPRLQMPVLVVTGANDTTVSPMRQRLLAERIPGAVQVVVADAGHAVPEDQPQVFNRLVLDFLGK
jgi:3-oxoadipate enol-lactonase